jgi:hypothetical protein
MLRTAPRNGTPPMDQHITVLTANVNSLRPKASVVAGWQADVVLLQETKVSAATVGSVRTTLAEGGKKLHHGLLCKAAERRTTRTASSARGAIRGGVAAITSTPRDAVQADPSPVAKDLRATGRWEEIFVPTSNAATHLGTAVVYGVSGAGQNSRCYRENEALL